MTPVFIVADNIYSPLGSTTEMVFRKIKAGESSIRQITDTSLFPTPFFASAFCANRYQSHDEFTRFERYCIASLEDTLGRTRLKLSDPDVLWILSTTKGNIELLEQQKMSEELRQKISLARTAKKIATYFNAACPPLVVSNACVSGVLSLALGSRLIRAGKYKHVIVTGADVLSQFVVSGFGALHAMSSKACKPFDKQREGINLGECAATVVLSAERHTGEIEGITVGGSAVSNDANHISGPSRTGDELAHAIRVSMRESVLEAQDLSFVSAHGTGTVYNDEMEAKALGSVRFLSVPVHSLKGYIGHTLGAAGVVESILTYQSLKNNIILSSKNFEETGVSAPIQINRTTEESDKCHALKTASGFGGCNTAILFSTT